MGPAGTLFMEVRVATLDRVQPQPVPMRQTSLWQAIWRHRLDYLFISPFFIIFGAFHAYPLVWAFVLSFQRWSGFGEARWVGLDNYRAVLSEELVRRALLNSLFFTAILVPTGVLLALTFAAILNLRNLPGRGLFRTLFFLPYITSTIIIGIVFHMLFDDTFGWINVILKSIGLEPLSWLRTAILAKISVIILTHWQGLGYNILIMLAGLQSIPREVYEAAEIDGANAWQIFWRVTIPLMKPVILFVTLVGTIGVLNMFNQPYILTRGGPDAATTTLALRLYELAFGTTRFGDAAALGFVNGTLVIVVTVIQLRVLREWRQ